LVVSEVQECPSCGNEFEVWFSDPEVTSVEEIVEPLEAEVPCPVCENVHLYLYSGWTSHEDA
jgi:hypothetical protein